MSFVKPLPAYLLKRYQGWHATSYAEHGAWYRRLAEEGQRPRAMFIACCDSRVSVSAVFGADAGEFFIHRNISSLVPEYTPNGDHHGTSAAVEFAVCVLKVNHIVVLGHTDCGGVKGCVDMCSGHAPELLENTSFIGRWLEIMRPGYEKIKDLPEEDQRSALEKQAVVLSLENLMTFPFVREAAEADQLALHGLVHDVGSGKLIQYEADTGNFVVI